MVKYDLPLNEVVFDASDRVRAPIGGKVITRETVRALRKESPRSATAATARVNENFWRSEGKVEIRQFGKVDIPQEALIAALKVDR